MKLQFPCDVCVELSKPIYAPGDTVEGTVVLRVFHEISCNSVSAQLRGVVTTAFTGQDELSRCVVDYKSEKVLVDQTLELTNPQRQHVRDFMKRAFAPTASKNRLRAASLESYDYENFSGFKPGTHRFPIQFLLPSEGLVTSFSARGSQASAKYSLLILVHTGGQEHPLHEHLVAVVLPAPIVRDPIAGQAVVEDSATIDKNRSVHAVLLLSKTEFLPTDPLYCNITVTNRWKKSLKYVYFNVVQEVTSWASAVYDKTRVGRKTEEVELTGVSLPYPIRKVDAGSTFTFSPEYYVTALVPNIEAQQCLTVAYYAQLRVGRSRNEVFLRCRIPIRIGTGYVDDDVVTVTDLGKDLATLSVRPSSSDSELYRPREEKPQPSAPLFDVFESHDAARAANDAANEQARLTCAICMSRPIGLAFGCGHATCEECGHSSKLSNCHQCRAPIVDRIRLYL